MRWLHEQLPTLDLALRNLDRSRARTALATLGIVIGVIAITTLGMFGTALELSAEQQLNQIGNEVTVTPASGDDITFGGGDRTLDRRELREIERIAGEEVTPTRRRFERVTYQEERIGAELLWVPNPEERYTAASGSIPPTFRSGVLVGSRVADELNVGPGDPVVVGDRTYRVRAVLESEGFYSAVSPDRALVVPENVVEMEGYSQAILETENATVASETADEIRTEMNRREKTVEVRGGTSFGGQVDSFYTTLNLFLLGVGGISLVVAGVSILNVMLMSTVERREEIGVMRAVGFGRRDVLKVLLAEAGLLGLAGTVVGVAVSVVAGLLLFGTMHGNPLLVFSPRNLPHVVVALVTGVGTSVLSGAYPAWRAATERPVDALRS